MTKPSVPAAPVAPVLTGDLASGVVRDIVQYPDPRLLQRCDPAGYLAGDDVRNLAADLLASMYAAGGRGLAAPQIGVMRRMFVMDSGWKDGVSDPQVMLDPEIMWQSPETETIDEQCLSIPNRPVAMTRPVAITMGWYDLNGRHQLRQLSGPDARIAQHEADHLDGRLILKD